MSAPIYLGIDIGKKNHHYCLVSASLLKQHKQRYQKCPQGVIGNARAEFDRLLSLARIEAGERSIHILVEHTGHYGYALEQFFQEQPGIKLYRALANKRYGRDKTDRKDAQALAIKLYSQIALRVPVTDEKEQVTRLQSPIPAAAQLRPFVQHRIDLSHGLVQHENRLTAILDQLFPELTEVYKEQNCASALSLRERYPTAQAVAQAELADLIATRTWTRPGNKAFAKLQALAKESIGLKEGPRQASLVIEQRHLIRELRLMQENEAELDELISAVLKTSREGQILCSFPGIGDTLAGQLLAGIGNIDNFETIGKFRAYLGWAPRRSQTGTTFDHSSLDKSGNRLCKQAMHQVAIAAIKHSPRWKALHARLQAKNTKMTSLGHVAGQIAGVLYILLKQDAELVRAHSGDGPLPEPKLYDRHR